MNSIKALVIAGLVGMGAMASADEFIAEAAWGVKELVTANDVALGELKAKVGTKLYDTVTGFTVEKSSKGTSARVKIDYVDGGVKKTASYFCHTHEKDIDCH